MEMTNEVDCKTDHQDNSDKDYCGYDVGADFHQGDEVFNSNCKKVGDLHILLDSQSTHSTLYAAHAVIFSVMWINFVPPKGGISNTLSLLYAQNNELIK
jgi:hypothetical protein